MAGTTRDNTTDGYWWLADALAYIGEHVTREKRPEEVLCNGAGDGAIGWRCHSVTVDEKKDYQAHPPIDTPVAAAYRFFWRRFEESGVELVRQTNCAYRVGPAVGLGFDGVGNVWPIEDARAISTWTATSVRFHSDDIVSYLTKLGLMSGEVAQEKAEEVVHETTDEVEAQEKPKEVAGASPVTPVLLPDNPRAILAALKLDGFQQQAIAEAVLEIYGRNPPESLTSGKLGKDLEARHKVKTAEARARGAAPPHKPAGWDARKAFTAALHAWRAKTASMIADDI